MARARPSLSRTIATGTSCSCDSIEARSVRGDAGRAENLGGGGTRFGSEGQVRRWKPAGENATALSYLMSSPLAGAGELGVLADVEASLHGVAS